MTAITERLSIALADRYRIERHLGAGGMATVYLAEDLKHKRRVAVKVLKPELAAVLGAERFVQEITTTASLSHPHILPLFDSGTADGFLFYVMPFIEGETLRDKLNRETQLGVDDAVRIASEVADALDYAHRRGVIHRDIKPENILLHDGRPMVADFGIALAVSAAAGGRMTETGLSLGTPHYMSPEQATAEKDITARSDVYSLASVLYEMLAGQPPHLGGSAQQIIMRIITDAARPVTELRKAVPSHVAAALAKALEKLPADRFASAKEFREALANTAFVNSAFATARSAAALAAPRADSWRERLVMPALALSLVLAALAAWGWSRPASSRLVSRYQIELPDGMQIGSANWSPLAVSPDGSALVYTSETGRLVLRSRGILDPRELPGTEGAFNPFFSTDGTRIGFMAGAAGSAEINYVSVSGGPPTTITTGAGGPGAAWGHDGYIYFDASGIGPLRRVRDTGGATAEDISLRDSAGGELQHNWPDPLPNGRGVLMVIDRAGPGVNIATTNEIAVLDLRTGKHRVLAQGVYARYTSTGHILYVTSDGVLMAVPFDQDRLELVGDAVALVEGITVRMGGGGVDLAISRTGTLWYGLGANAFRRTVSWSSREGVYTPIDPSWAGAFNDLALSPDGERLAVTIVDPGGEQIWVKDVRSAGGRLSKLTFEGVNQAPTWHPGGALLGFVTTFLPAANMRSVRADGTSPEPTVVVPNAGRTYAGQWSPDGNWVVLETYNGPTLRDIVAHHPGGDTVRTSLVASRFLERNPSISPNGRWLLYQSNTDGSPEVYVRPFPHAASQLFQVSSGGGSNPKWSRDGREVYFVNANAELVSTSVSSGESFTVNGQRILFPLRGIADWDVAPGGRFVVIHERGGRTAGHLVVVENFFEELRAKVPR
jgi:serine/threonine protein kinase/Tol biopolymer transport system component